METPPVNPEPPSDNALEKHRLPPPISPSERDTFEAKIQEQQRRIEELEAQLAEIKNPPPTPENRGKSKWTIGRFAPLQ